MRRQTSSPELRALFKERVESWAKRLKVRPTRIRIQPMTSKWASCSTAGWVSFADDLLKESKAFQDYVIVHELLHLRLPNHGKLFTSLLSAYIPNYKHFEKRAGEKKVIEGKATERSL
ncbi:MAG: M48 family metallopeptidase [Acidobacteriota bacterium]